MHMHVCVCCGQLIGEKVAHKTEEVCFRQMQAIAGTTTTLLLLFLLCTKFPRVKY